MSGVFLSYRRADTLQWAGRLFDHLSKSFGKSQVFMDIEGGIPRGADFEQTLERALAGCDALLALIGPAWLTCTRSDNHRRLDVEDDWVRNEIRSALRRGVVVMPVLLGGAHRPAEADLPEDLHLLCKRQTAEVTDTRWAYDVGEIVKDLAKLTSLPILDDVAAAKKGILLLKDLVTRLPAVADAVSRSKEVIANTYRRVGKLERLKTIHDALHTIEFECLRPIQAGGAVSRIRPFKVTFASAARQIENALQEQGTIPRLRDDLEERLASASAAFDAAVTGPETPAHGRLVGELDLLLSRLPSEVDAGISDAATELELDRLVELIAGVRHTLLVSSPTGPGPELELFAEGTEALQRLRDELNGRVSGHTQLQRLDSRLRVVCVGGIAPGTLAGEWERIKKVRAKLVEPYCLEIPGVADDLGALESQIEVAVGKGDQASALDLLREYFRTVCAVFRDVDGGLREFCLRLTGVSQPLKAVLEVC